MNEIEKELELCEYLEKWIRSRYQEWNAFYYDVSRNRRNGIYLLKNGTKLMDLLITIIGNIEDRFSLPDDNSHLIPTQFASTAHIIGYLKRFQKYVDSFKPILNSNVTDGVIDNYIVAGIYNMIDSIDQVTERCIKIYDNDTTIPRPYQILREQLFNKDIDGFVESVNGALKAIPYLCRKKKFDEGHFQTMIQLLLTVLGFEPVAEQVLSDGRIDMVVKLDNITYIFEFKYTDGRKSQAKKALLQIIKNGYAEPFKLSSKEIVAVGISFSGVTKCINGHKEEKM